MNIRLFLFSFLLSVFSLQSGRAQDSLSMGQSVIWNHDTAVFNQTLNVTVTVFNYGTSAYADSMTIYAKLTSNNPHDTVAIINHTPVASLPIGDSTQVSMNWIVDPLKYVGGGNNITVIWPSNPNSDNAVGDSLNLSTFIDTALGITMWLPTEFKIYPNPSRGQIKLEFSEQTDIENVRIYSLRGRLIEQFKARNNYDLSILPAGSYMIQVEDKKGRLSKGQLVIRE